MKGVVIVALSVSFLVIPVVIPLAASSAGAQDSADVIQSLGILADHLRPKWIKADYRTDLAPSDDPLETVHELKIKKKAKRLLERPSLLLVFSSEEPVTQDSFEQILFQHPDLVMGAKAFVCLRLDIRKNEPIAQRYDGSVPRFLVFDRKGRRRADISMAGFHHRPDALFEVMKQVVSSYGSIPLEAFIERYKGLLTDLVPIDSALQKLASQEAKLARQRGADVQAKKDRLQAERQQWLEKRKAWLARERAFFKEYHKKKG